MNKDNFSNNRKNVSKWVSHWDAKASIENQYELNGYCVQGKPLSEEVYYKAIIKPNIERLELESSHHVLEIGCGSGLILREIEKMVTKSVGTDISQKMLSRFSGKSKTIKCAAGELRSYFHENEFDRILMVGVALYFPSFGYFKSVVEDVLTILRKGGIFLIGDLLLGVPPANSQYTFYDKHELISYFDIFGLPYTLSIQSRLKRTINQRYDIILYKD